MVIDGDIRSIFLTTIKIKMPALLNKILKIGENPVFPSNKICRQKFSYDIHGLDQKLRSCFWFPSLQINFFRNGNFLCDFWQKLEKIKFLWGKNDVENSVPKIPVLCLPTHPVDKTLCQKFLKYLKNRAFFFFSTHSIPLLFFERHAGNWDQVIAWTSCYRICSILKTEMI